MFKRTQPFSEQVCESLRDLAVEMTSRLDEARAGGTLTDNVYHAFAFAVVTSRDLVFSLLCEKQSPLYRLRPTDLPDPEAPVHAFVDLITATLYQLKREMEANSELAAKLEMPHPELTRLFCELIGLEHTEVWKMLQGAEELHPEEEGSFMWDVWVAYFRETLTGRVEGIPFNHKAWKSGYNDVVAFYGGLTSMVVGQSLGRLRASVGLSR